MKSKNNLPVTNNDIKDFDFTEWGKMDDIPGFINKCESMNNNLLKAIERFELILNRKESTQEDVFYLKTLDFDFKMFSFIPIAVKISKAESEKNDIIVAQELGFKTILLLRLVGLVFGKKGKVKENYFPDDVVEADQEKRILFESLIIKHLEKSIIAYCNFQNNKVTYKWYDKKEEFKSIIILNVEGYKFIEQLYDNIFDFFILLPFHLIQKYTPKSVGFGFSERKRLADKEPDIIKKKHIFAEGMAQLEFSLLGTKDIAYAFNKHEYPNEIIKYKKAIQVLDDQIKHSVLDYIKSDNSKSSEENISKESNEVKINIDSNQENNKRKSIQIEKLKLDDFFKDKSNTILISQIQNEFQSYAGKSMAIVLYLLFTKYELINIFPNSKTQSRKHFVSLLKNSPDFDGMFAINKCFQSGTDEISVSKKDALFISINEKIAQMIKK
jgi:gas vesicle protein